MQFYDTALFCFKFSHTYFSANVSKTVFHYSFADMFKVTFVSEQVGRPGKYNPQTFFFQFLSKQAHCNGLLLFIIKIYRLSLQTVWSKDLIHISVVRWNQNALFFLMGYYSERCAYSAYSRNLYLKCYRSKQFVMYLQLAPSHLRFSGKPERRDYHEILCNGHCCYEAIPVSWEFRTP